MRLFPRLLFSHLAPSAVLTAALALILIALVRLTMMLGQLNDRELGEFGLDWKLHAITWDLDVAMRHGQDMCAHDRNDAADPVKQNMTRGLSALQTALTDLGSASQDIRRISLRYRDLGGRVIADDACAALLSGGVQRERALLDEELTNLWVSRLGELRGALQAKDDEARALGKVASLGGGTLALLAFAAALLLAHRLARDVGSPLNALSALAKRVGRGDFHGRVEVEGPAEVVLLAQDLERMRARLAELESLKQGFLASVSHELRTPLSKIREALALLSDGAVGPLGERQARVVEIAQIACEREIRMVTTLLDFSRLRAGAPLRLRAGASVDALVRSAVQDEEHDARARRVQVDLELEGEAPTTSLDSELLERAVANLVRNAVGVSKASQRVEVRRDLLDEGPEGKSGRWARILVRDHGPGVPDDLRDTIFDAFVTQAVPKSPKAIGVGLGLALAREVARAHGGDLVLGRNGSDGAEFHLWLPLERPAPEALAGALPFATLVPST